MFKLNLNNLYNIYITIMMEKKFAVITFLLLFLIGINVVSASENITDDMLSDDEILPSDEDVNLDVVDEDSVTQTSSLSFKNLQDIINKVKDGGKINLLKNRTYDSEKDSNSITIKKSLTINGNGITLDGNKESRIFLIGNKNAKINVVLKNLVFVNGYATEGAAIKLVKSSDVDLEIINCTFKDNYAYNSCGGAIYSYMTNSNINIKDSTFINNIAENSGGAISTQGQYTTVSNSIFKNNNAKEGYGGAVEINDENSPTISNSNFESNNADLYGGAISYMSSLPVTVSDCSFTKNTANVGGALYLSCYYVNCKITNSVFKSNTAKKSGGAISSEYHVNIVNSVFNDNNLPELEVQYKNYFYAKYNSGNNFKVKIVNSLNNQPVKDVQVKLYVKLSNGGKKYSTKVLTAVTDKKGFATFKISKLSQYYYYGHFKFANSFKYTKNSNAYGFTVDSTH